MVKANRIDTPKPKKTKLYWGTLLLSWIPFIGLAFSVNGVIRSVLKVIKSKKEAKKIDKRAMVGAALSSIALFISLVAINVALNPTPAISLADAKTSTDDTSYTLTGKISNMENETSKLTVNGVATPLNNGEFSYKVDLKEGDNTFNIAATNDNGETKETMAIHRTTQAEFTARAEAEAKNKTDAKAQADAKAKAEANARAAAATKDQAGAQDQHKAYIDSANNNAFYINNAYFKGDSKYDIVVYSSNRDTLQIYVNDKNPVKAKVNKDGWATFKKVKLTGRSKLSFAKKVGWFKYYPVNFVKYISVDNQKVKLMDADAIAALEKAEEEARVAKEKAEADAKAAKTKADADAKAAAKAKAQAQHVAYIDGLATTYCSNHQGNRNIYIPQVSSRDVWENPNKDLLSKYPKHSNCVSIMTFFIDTMPSKNLDNIINAKVGTGMNTAEALAAWGWPNNNSNFSSAWGSSGTWTWDSGTCYYGVCPHQQFATFYDGTITATGNY